VGTAQFECPRDPIDGRCLSGNFPEPTDCERFWICANCIGFPQKCPFPLHFSPVTQNCIFPEVAGCQPTTDAPSTTTPATTTQTTTTPTTTVITTPPSTVTPSYPPECHIYLSAAYFSRDSIPSFCDQEIAAAAVYKKLDFIADLDAGCAGANLDTTVGFKPSARAVITNTTEALVYTGIVVSGNDARTSPVNIEVCAAAVAGVVTNPDFTDVYPNITTIGQDDMNRCNVTMIMRPAQYEQEEVDCTECRPGYIYNNITFMCDPAPSTNPATTQTGTQGGSTQGGSTQGGSTQGGTTQGGSSRKVIL